MIRLYWNKGSEGDDIRFKIGRYRAGGPWMTKRVVHTLASRFGFAFQWKGSWRFFGLLVMADRREITEADALSPASLTD